MTEFCTYARDDKTGGAPTDAFCALCIKGVRPNEVKQLIAELPTKGRSASWFSACHEYEIVGDEALAAAQCGWRNDLPGDNIIDADGTRHS